MVCPVAYVIKILSKKTKLIYFEPIYLGEGVQIKPEFVRVSRQRLARIADLCLVPNEARLVKFLGDVGDHGNTIFAHNFPRDQEFKGIPFRENPETGKLKLFCFGFLGLDKLPLQLFEALEELKDKVELVVAGIDRYRGPNRGNSYSAIIRNEINDCRKKLKTNRQNFFWFAFQGTICSVKRNSICTHPAHHVFFNFEAFMEKIDAHFGGV